MLFNKKIEFIDFISPSFQHMQEFQSHTLARILISFIPIMDMLHRNKINPRKIYSFGSGSCSHEAFMSDIFSKAVVNCFDMDEKYIPEYAQKKIAGSNKLSFTEVAVESLNWGNYKNSADLVFSIQTLEHIEDFETALSNLCLTVKPGGYIYIDTPFFSENDENEDPGFLEHERNRQWNKNRHFHLGFSLKNMKKRLASLNFDVVDSGYSSYVAGDSRFLKSIRSDDIFLRKNATKSLAAGMSGVYHALLSEHETSNKENPLIDQLSIKKRRAAAIRVLAIKKG